MMSQANEEGKDFNYDHEITKKVEKDKLNQILKASNNLK